MKYIKIFSKFFLIISCCIFSCESFAASETTKQLINKTLAKYGISAGGKEICGQGKEPDYDEQTGVVKCKNDKQGDDNNCWDAASRLCKECPDGTIVSKQDNVTCRQIICPEGYELIEVKDETCPEGFEMQEFNENNCGSDYYGFDGVMATNNYSTQPINCKDIN